jgi:hypothetical protein
MILHSCLLVMYCGRRSWPSLKSANEPKKWLPMEVGPVIIRLLCREANSPGLVPDELMLDVVKAELDRLKGKVSFVCRATPQS